MLRKPILRSKLFAVFWVAAICALSLTLIGVGGRGPMINGNLMALLPVAERDPVVFDAVSRVETRFQRHVALLIRATEFKTAKAAARHVVSRLAASGQFEKLHLSHESDIVRRAFTYYFPLRFQLLGNGARDQLRAGDIAAFERAVLRRYYNPRTVLNSALVDKDPLLLLPQFMEERAVKAVGRPDIKDGYLTVQSGGRIYIVVIGELSGSPFSLPLQQNLMPLFGALRSELQSRFHGTDFLMAGVLPHAAAGTRTALSEMSTVGLGSLLGIIVMLVAMFRSPRPFILTLSSIALGCLGGFAACMTVFGEVHLLTLVFGASLVGISVDYSLHFFCERYRFDANWSPPTALNHIFPSITLGLVTSVIGFFGLFLAPFPGMQGMALFSAVGLSIAYGCVAICYPHVTRGLGRPTFQKPLDWVRGYGALWHGKRAGPFWITSGVLAVLSIAGCLRLVASDDVRLLQSPDVQVMAEEIRTRALIGRNLASQFFLVEGRDEADFLVREEWLTERLRDLQKSGRLEGYLAMSDFIGSPERQKENRALLTPLIAARQNVLDRVAGQVGLPKGTRDAYVAAFLKSAEDRPVGLTQWLAHPVSEPYRHLWLGRSARGVSGVVGLRGVHDRHALQALAASRPSLHFIDPADDISKLLGDYRVRTVWLTLISYIAVLLILILRYGVRGGVIVMMPPVIAAVVSMGILGFLGEPISLFNIMGLLLVLGIGVDYALFFRETGMDNPSTLLAIALSCITTLLAFGLLALSSTTAVHAFGLTILVGILAAFLLSPMAGWNRKGNAQDDEQP